MTRRRVCLGAFAGAHGVRGEAKVKTFTQTEERVASYGPLETEDGARRFSLKFLRVLKPGLALVAAPEIQGREDAETLAGVRLYADRAALPETAEGEFYIEDLVGLAAQDETGAPVGIIIAVHNFGAGDVLEIGERPAGAPSVMIPFTSVAVPAIDLASGRLTVAGVSLAEMTVSSA